MNTYKLTRKSNNLTTITLSLLATIAFGFSTSSQASDLSAQSDLVESNLSALISSNVSNLSIIHQIGNNNRAVVTQRGDNTTIITELGNNNVAKVNQDGFGNNAIVTQIGNGNDIEISQIGSFNTAITTQIGGAGYKVEQIGDNMNVTVTQFTY
jgi:minor curlin subunit